MREIVKKLIAILMRVIFPLTKIIPDVKLPERKMIKDNLYKVWSDHGIYSEMTFQDEKIENEVILSLIIPFYNAGHEYIKKCLESLLEQETDYPYNIICIDDGSKDDTLEELNRYKDHNPEKIIVFHQDNAGISCARNMGIRLSNAEYIGFIDQDDWVSPQYIDTLLKHVDRSAVDIVKCSHAVIKDGHKYSEYRMKDFLSTGKLGDNIFDISGMIWSGIYKRNLFEKIRFPEKYWYEDMIARLLLYRYANSFESVSDILYFKRKHEGNASSVLWSGSKSQCLDHLYLVKHLIEESIKLELDDDILYRCILHEMGQYLMWRTRGQNSSVRKDAFYEACYVIGDLKRNVANLSVIEKRYESVFETRNYLGWLCISWRDWALTR